jgi:hypothetical protein
MKLMLILIYLWLFSYILLLELSVRNSTRYPQSVAHAYTNPLTTRYIYTRCVPEWAVYQLSIHSGIHLTNSLFVSVSSMHLQLLDTPNNSTLNVCQSELLFIYYCLHSNLSQCLNLSPVWSCEPLQKAFVIRILEQWQRRLCRGGRSIGLSPTWASLLPEQRNNKFTLHPSICKTSANRYNPIFKPKNQIQPVPQLIKPVQTRSLGSIVPNILADMAHTWIRSSSHVELT